MSRTVTTSGSEDCGAQDLFTPEFKYLKARSPLPDLSRVIDLSKDNLESQCINGKAISRYPVRSCGLKSVAGLKPCGEWKAYQFSDCPGLIIIQNPFIDGYQRYWVYRCLQNFPSDRENVTNLTALEDENSRDLWHEFVQKKCSTLDRQDPLRKLRWTTLGYHYNWTTKEYSEENKAPFPSDVNCLSQYFAACLGFVPYQAEAAIVNYYHLDSTLAGHTDHSEMDHSAPLFSISFGQTAIFLLGGQTKSVRPMSVFLRSGDICVMSRECRLAYHAVPKILAPPFEESIPSSFKLTQIPWHEVFDTTTPNSGPCDLCTDSATPCIAHCGLCDGTEEKDQIRPCCTAVGKSGDTLSVIINSCGTNVSLESEGSHPGHCHKAIVGRAAAENKTATSYNDNDLSHKEYISYFENYDCSIGRVNSRIEEVIATLDFSPFEVYLKSSRINLNIRQVLPPGWTKLPEKHQLERSENSSHVSNESLCGKLINRDLECVCDHNVTDPSGLVTAQCDDHVVAVSQRHEEGDFDCSEVEIVKKIKTDLSAT